LERNNLHKLSWDTPCNNTYIVLKDIYDVYISKFGIDEIVSKKELEELILNEEIREKDIDFLFSKGDILQEDLSDPGTLASENGDFSIYVDNIENLLNKKLLKRI